MPDPRPPRTLVLVPTQLERGHLTDQTGLGPDVVLELCGFGPVAAAARASSLIAQHHPDRVILTGIAGTFDREVLPIGTASLFARVIMHGVGVGSGAGFVPAGAIGFPQWPGDGAPDSAIGDDLALTAPMPPAPGPLLTCGAASVSAEDAGQRLDRFPGVLAEDMEGFAVALACRLARVPVAVVRGFSNQVGDRRVDRWHIPEALDAARSLVLGLIDRPAWERPT